MKKIVIKEFDKTLLILDIMLYCVFVTIGFILLNFSEIELLNPMEYASPLFYMFGFFSLLTYFLNRREGNYELLIFGFINVCVASFVFIYTSYPDSGFILADAVLIYSIANVINKGYYSIQLLKEKNINFFPKISITILLLFLGVFVVSSLYNKIEVGSLILGYYFIIFGLLSLLEPLISILTKNEKLEKAVLEFLAYEVKDENKTIEVKKEKTEEKPINKKVKATKIVKSPSKKIESKSKIKEIKITTSKKTTRKTQKRLKK